MVNFLKASKLFAPILKQDALDGSLSLGYRNLLRGGFIRQSAAGLYMLLPLGLRVVEKIEKIIDQEMQAIDGQKLSFPTVLPSDAWKKTGRWESTGSEMFKLRDRKGGEFCLAPTHEEEVTRLVASEVHSQRQLPLRLYQVGHKFRDELRPRSGLLRAREFIMKDMYSFDVNPNDAEETYYEVMNAYKVIFSRIGVPFVWVEADTGNIGGSLSHEFHFISSEGDDKILSCSSCDYSANEELARGKPPNTSREATPSHTALAQYITGTRSDMSIDLYTLSSATGDQSPRKQVLVIRRSDRRVNAIKLKKHPYLDGFSIDEPVDGLSVLQTVDPDIKIVVDTHASAGKLLPGPKLGNIQWAVADVCFAEDGDSCPSCENPLVSSRGIEVGHTFYLGTKYSSRLSAIVKDRKKATPIEMGCFGIGVSRILGAVAEQSAGENVVWPLSIAPYHVVVIPSKRAKGKIGDDEIEDAALEVVQDLSDHGVEVVYDDREDLTVGYKLKDAQAIGYPFIVVFGKDWSTSERLEFHDNTEGKKASKSLTLNEVMETITNLVYRSLHST